MIQTILAYIIVAGAILWAWNRLHQVAKGKRNPCSGCSSGKNIHSDMRNECAGPQEGCNCN